MTANTCSSKLSRTKQVVAISLLTVCLHATSACAADETEQNTTTSRIKNATTKALSTAEDIASGALDLIGVRYRFGGNTPATGLDCSGYVRYVFQQVTGLNLPRTARGMSEVGTQVSRDDLKPGDLVFFNTRRLSYSHVGIYLGDNKFAHAPRTGKNVEISSLNSSYWQRTFNGARRLIGTIPSLASLTKNKKAITSDAGSTDEFVQNAEASAILTQLDGETNSTHIQTSIQPKINTAAHPTATLIQSNSRSTPHGRAHHGKAAGAKHKQTSSASHKKRHP